MCADALIYISFNDICIITIKGFEKVQWQSQRERERERVCLQDRRFKTWSINATYSYERTSLEFLEPGWVTRTTGLLRGQLHLINQPAKLGDIESEAHTEARSRYCNWSAVKRCSSHVLDFKFALAALATACSEADADADSDSDTDAGLAVEAGSNLVATAEQKRCEGALGSNLGTRLPRVLAQRARSAPDFIAMSFNWILHAGIQWCQFLSIAIQYVDR